MGIVSLKLKEEFTSSRAYSVLSPAESEHGWWQGAAVGHRGAEHRGNVLLGAGPARRHPGRVHQALCGETRGAARGEGRALAVAFSQEKHQLNS